MVKRRNSGGARQPAQLEWWEKPMVTPKGTFQFTPVADGVYIEHNWNQVCPTLAVLMLARPF
eukprot:6188337-Pleurochrysis_carterae.AAC.3